MELISSNNQHSREEEKLMHRFNVCLLRGMDSSNNQHSREEAKLMHRFNVCLLRAMDGLCTNGIRLRIESVIMKRVLCCSINTE